MSEDDLWKTTERAGQVWNFPMYDVDRNALGHQDISLVTALVVQSLGYPDDESPSQEHVALVIETDSECAHRQPGCLIRMHEPAYKTWENASSYTRLA